MELTTADKLAVIKAKDPAAWWSLIDDKITASDKGFDELVDATFKTLSSAKENT